jgi:asparagine synthetase B (glutamine-hydrolysing)
MGGYGRHRKAWERGGSEQLRQELDLDMGRLWDRNLGRDDRVLSDSSKEARFPFLDPDAVQFLQSQPLENVVDFSLPPGQGDKRILRLVAARLGLPAASAAVKRAIQFGSRIAHVSDKQRFGSRRKAKGVASVPQSES